jgi:hypothetical protein
VVTGEGARRGGSVESLEDRLQAERKVTSERSSPLPERAIVDSLLVLLLIVPKVAMHARSLIWALFVVSLTTCVAQTTDDEQLANTTPGYVIHGEIPRGVSVEDVLARMPPRGIGVVGDPSTGQVATIVSTPLDSPQAVSSHFSVTSPANCPDCGASCENSMTRTIVIGLTQTSGPDHTPLRVQTHSSMNFALPQHSPASWISSVGSDVSISTSGTLGTCATFSYYFDISECGPEDDCVDVEPHWDNDGDCYCEMEPCLGSIEQDGACAGVLLQGGDCDDSDPLVNPGMSDAPDPDYIDANCDGIDGDILDSIFLDPVGGSNANSGLDTLEPVLTLDTAYQRAVAEGRGWILISAGSPSLNGNFIEGIGLAGGYDAFGDWQRYEGSLPTIQLPNTGRMIVGWSTPTEWHQIEVRAANALLSTASSVTLTVSNSNGLSIVDSVIFAGNGAAGSPGSTPLNAAPGGHGGFGGNGFRQSACCGSCSFFCLCDLGCGACELDRPQRGSAGASCGVSGFAGGLGGWSSHPTHGTATSGTAGEGAGGTGGAGTNALGAPGGHGFAGLPGTSGTSGVGGAPIGIFHIGPDRYAAASGGAGGTGGAGGGGGGGGGGGPGGWTSGNCDVWGGAGGGGGGGGCGGGGGGGGSGGGASVALVLLDGASVALANTTLITGQGGSGGAAGMGGQGGDGGQGGSGGAGEVSTVNEPSGPGGNGGNGAAGGQGGHGGGGGGGPSVGIVCQGGGNLLSEVGSVFQIGSPGLGGTSSGANGQTGRTGNTDGC